jgi:threonine/homoserine/homoserine lactone efflux protein
MTEALIQGIGWGFLLSLTVGPVFFALIQTSIHNGFKAGALMAMGIMMSDSLYIVVTYLGVSSINNEHSLKIWLGIMGGLIMVIFGLTTLFKKPATEVKEDNSPTFKKVYKYLFKGFALNGINPFVFIFWLGISSFVNFQSDFSRPELIIYFCSIVAVVFSIDLTKVFLANRLRDFITERFQTILNRFVGSGLLIFGIYMIAMSLTGRL